MLTIIIPPVRHLHQTACCTCKWMWFSGHLMANDKASTQTGESIRWDCTMSCCKQATVTAGSFCLRFLALLSVLTSFSSRPLSHLSKLASNTSRFLSSQLHDPNGRKGSLPGNCSKMSGIDTHWSGSDHMLIPRQTAMAKGIGHSDWLLWSHMLRPGTTDYLGGNGLTQEMWVPLLEKVRINASKSIVVPLPKDWECCLTSSSATG